MICFIFAHAMQGNAFCDLPEDTMLPGEMQFSYSSTTGEMDLYMLIQFQAETQTIVERNSCLHDAAVTYIYVYSISVSHEVANDANFVH